LRNGVTEDVHHNYLHVGDVIFIDYGMKIPVDGLVLSATQLTCDEAAMTGESDEMRKDSVENCMERMEELEMEKKSSTQPNPHDLPSPILLSGTGVAGGEGRMLAIMVGEASAIGQIRKTLEVRDEETPLQGKLDKIATDIGLMGTYAAVLTIHILLLRFLFEGLMERSIDLFGGEADASNLLLANL